VLAQHDYTGCGRTVTNLGRRTDAFVGTRRWHTDVGEYDVGRMFVDCGQQLVEIAGHANDIDVGEGAQQTTDPVAQAEVVLGDLRRECPRPQVGHRAAAPVRCRITAARAANSLQTAFGIMNP
jgi:hypothetical protein